MANPGFLFVSRTVTIFVFVFFTGFLSGQQSGFPAFPPNDVTSSIDHDQMLWQLGIKLPQLPPKLLDPNKPLNAFPSDKNNPDGNWTDEAKHTITRSAFGLWNNYSDKSAGFFPGSDSARLGNYTPINLLKMKNGKVINSTDEWWSIRRPEILKDLQEELYGKIPADSLLPKISWSVTTTTGGRGSSAYIQKEITGTLDVSRYPEVRNKPVISATMRTPANATGPVPVIIFFGGFGNAIESYWMRSNPSGWGICIFNLAALQPDNGAGLTSYLIGLVNKGNWRKPADWGTLVAWSWGVSRLIDYFETDRSVNAKIIGLTGHSRYGKATLVTMAYEPRVAIGFPSDGGSLGTKMNRRHWGQDLENSTGANEYHWMSGTFFKWAGERTPGQYLPRKIEDCPVDAHSLLALCAPRPVLLNGGTNSSWTDPYGQYLTTVYASPVYELLGKKGIIMNDPKPVIDKAYIDGGVAFRYHNGGHTDAPEWPAFFEFAAKHFDITTLTVSTPAITLEAMDKLTETFSVVSNKNWKISASDSWLKINAGSSSKNDSVAVTASINKLKEARSSVLSISAGNQKVIVEVNQGSAKPSLEVSGTELSIGEKAISTVNLDIKSNTAWRIIVPKVEESNSGFGQRGSGNWLSTSDEVGLNNKTITLSASANPGVQKRIMKIEVSAAGVTVKKITITQKEGEPSLNIMTGTLNLESKDGSSASFRVMSNTTWNLKCSESWLSATPATGGNFSQVTVTAKENTASSERSGTVTVTVEGLSPRVIDVIQKAR
jgi:hypothetical protein